MKRYLLLILAAIVCLNVSAQIDKLNSQKKAQTEAKHRKQTAMKSRSKTATRPAKKAEPAKPKVTSDRRMDASDTKLLDNGSLAYRTYSYYDYLTAAGYEGSITLDVDFPTGGNSNLVSAIADWICSTLCDVTLCGGTSTQYSGDRQDGAAFVEYYGKQNSIDIVKVMTLDDRDARMGITDEWSVKIVAEGMNYVTLEANRRSMGSKSMNYDYENKIRTFRKSDGRRLSDDEVFKDYESKLAIKNLVSNQLKRELSSGEYTSEYPLPENGIAFTTHGLRLCYQTYEVGCHADGRPEVTIPYDKAAPYLSTEAKALYTNNLGDVTVSGITYSLHDGTAELKNASAARNDVVIPETMRYCGYKYVVNAIGDGAFAGNANVTSVTVPAGVETIAPNAFKGCRRLTAVSLPAGIKSLPSRCFYNCLLLADVSLPEGLVAIGDQCFGQCTSLSRLVIPSSVREIGVACFMQSALTDVTLPEGLKSLSPSCFNQCDRLASVKLPTSLTSIGKYAFSGCSSLASISIPTWVDTLRNETFSDCQSLKMVTLPDGMVLMQDGCFRGCTALETISLPLSLKYLGANAFRGCKALRQVKTNYSLQTIGEQCFRGCNSLTSIDIPMQVETLCAHAFSSCQNLRTVNLSDGLLAVQRGCFQDCIALDSIALPTTLKSLGARAFAGCKALRRVMTKNALETIGNECFMNCEQLQEFVFPAAVTEIGSNCFKGDYMLTSVTCLWMSPEETTLGTDVFSGINPEAILYLPRKAKKLFKEAPQWMYFKKRKNVDNERFYTIRPLPEQPEKE